jgi:5-methylcytosine-specific restriction endonuclease McrA
MPEQSYNRPRLTGLTPRQAMAVAGIRRDGEGRFSIDPIVYNIIPVSRGGKNMLANLLPSCVHCNSRKRAKTFFEFLRLV